MITQYFTDTTLSSLSNQINAYMKEHHLVIDKVLTYNYTKKGAFKTENKYRIFKTEDIHQMLIAFTEENKSRTLNE